MKQAKKDYYVNDIIEIKIPNVDVPVKGIIVSITSGFEDDVCREDFKYYIYNTCLVYANNALHYLCYAIVCTTVVDEEKSQYDEDGYCIEPEWKDVYVQTELKYKNVFIEECIIPKYDKLLK